MAKFSIMLVLFASSCLVSATDQIPHVYARANIGGLGAEGLNRLKTDPGVKWWVECDRELLVLVEIARVERLRRIANVERLPVRPQESLLVFVSLGHGADADGRAGQILARGGRFAVMQLYPTTSLQDVFLHDDGSPDDGGCNAGWVPFRPNTVLASAVENQSPRTAPKARAVVQELVDAVDGQRYMANLTKLAGWSRVSGSAGVDEAADWLVEQFARLPGMTVRRQPFSFNGTQAKNVVATLPGLRNDDIYIICAHYDSIASRDGGRTAPGAEDNGTGTIAVLEMARILSVYRPDATFLFICFSGEEQGLHGSRYHVTQLQDAGLTGKVKAVCNMDMIGYSSDADLDMLLETGGAGIALLDPWIEAAQAYTTLRIVTSTNPFGSDHVPYINAGMPSLLTIENEYETYPGYHRSTDTIEKVTEVMAIETVKMNLAAIANMSGYRSFDEPVTLETP